MSARRPLRFARRNLIVWFQHTHTHTHPLTRHCIARNANVAHSQITGPCSMCVYVCMTFIAPSPVKSAVSRDRISSNRSDTYAPTRHSPSDSYTVRPPEPGGTVTCPICHSQLLSSLHRRGSAKHTPAFCVSCLLPLPSLQTWYAYSCKQQRSSHVQ